MTNSPRKSGSDLFIVDNSDDDWKAVRYLHQWAEIAHTIDIATGYFEIGALLALDGQWQKLDKIRLLMGDEVSLRTKRAFEEGLANITGRLDDSIEVAKEGDDFLSGVPAIVEAIKSGQIEARVYRKRKFHAKAYITYPKLEVVGSAALVGSSNFTYPGLHQNVELNINLRQATDVKLLQEWYEEHWAEAEDVTPDILKTIERHTRQYSPFEVYARAMTAYYRSYQLSAGEWEKHESKMYPVLDQYQRDGYHQLMKIAVTDNYKGALLCDGVGLGKTFIGLMVIERLLFERKRVALFVPKAARKDVWEVKLRRFLPGALKSWSNLLIYNHTDLLRGGEYPARMQDIAADADAILIDEAHHFRNISSDRARKLYKITEGKLLFLLTATPINNSLYDLMHLIELFSRRKRGYFSGPPLGIHTLRGHFRKMEEALDRLVEGNGDGHVELDIISAEQILDQDNLFRALVVQRSRAYVRRSLQQHGGQKVTFPTRKDPQIANYSLYKTYGGLLDSLEKAFKKDKSLVSLPIYNPLGYLRSTDDELDPFEMGRQKQVVALIRTLLLKRFESSARAFEASCEDLLLKLLYFTQLHGPKYARRWEHQHADLLNRIKEHLKRRNLQDDEEDLDEDFIPAEFKKKIIKLSDKQFKVTDMILDVTLDMDELARFLDELKDFDPAYDDKLQTLITLLQTHPILKQHKVLIFTEYMNTARYLANQLKAVGIGPLIQVDSQRGNQSLAIHSFSPYYNESNSAELSAAGILEKRILITTDVLSEGLNLQDGTCIINYDLHWNPVRLMQRIGRVDRRLDPAMEDKMIADHPELADIRGVVHLWNFLPPNELNRILSLYRRVTHKTLRISKTFGIEGRKLLTPEDDYDALREFNQAYEGKTTSAEEMYLAYQQLLQDQPEIMKQVETMPLRVFSGKAFNALPSVQARALFFCYRLPARDAASGEWNDKASFTRWYLYDFATEKIEEEATRIFTHLQCEPDAPYQTVASKESLTDIRRKLDKYILKTYLRKVQAPMGVKSTLLAWMELV